MTPERLQRLRGLLGTALAHEAGERAAFVAAATAGDATLRAELQALLAVAEQDDDRFEPPPPPDDAEPRLAADQRLGAWRLLSPLGSGGMGEVWLAERADGAYSQRVAIKVPRPATRGPTAFARFERERALLAELEHPGIARLVDGGWTPTGRPWLAMEHVSGRPIDVHCTARGLDARGRTRLLVDALRALAAAHRARIVHRDLKPGNVLVRDDGEVVLVDFGIAAALDAATTTAVAYLATPRYSAPEQLAGAPATTAVDVFSMAVLGRELLGADADADLEAVFAAAAAADPEQRTPSADAFAAELQRWLAHLPVTARRPSCWHRLRLWRRRAPGSVAAVAALLVTALTLLITSTLLWRAERVARQRANAARSAQAERFAQVRALVGDLIVGVHDRIARLPGAVPVREFVVERAEQHLALLARDADDDTDLAREVIGAHIRLAEVRGARNLGNAGDQDGALRSAIAATALAERWHQRRPKEAHWLLLAAEGRRLAGDLRRAVGDAPAARREYEAARDLLAAAGDGHDARRRTRLAAIVTLQLARLDAAGGASEPALAGLRVASERLAALAAETPDDPDLLRDAALARSEQGFTLAQLGRGDEATAAWQAALAQLTSLGAVRPDDAQLRRDRLEIELELAFESARAGDPAAMARCERALGDARAACAADAGNVLAERLLHRALLRMARIARARGDQASAASHAREAAVLLRAAHELLPGDHGVRLDLAEALIGAAEADRTRGTVDGVEAAFEAGLALLDAEGTLASGDHLAGNLLTMAWIGLANLALTTGDVTTARARFARWHAATTAWAERCPELAWPLRHLAIFEYGFGSACEQAGSDATLPVAERRSALEAAHTAFTRGLRTAERLAAAGRLLGPDRALPKLFAMDVARIEAALGALPKSAGEPRDQQTR